MSTITFDTLKYAERLEKAGLTREQASAMAEAQKEVFAEALETQLATKPDIARLENRIEQMELKLTIKLGAMMVVAVGAVAALVKLL
jgi:hypothetical protein